jgi:hypothetical protein
VRTSISFTSVACCLALFAAAVQSANAAPPSDACSLLTEAQVSDILGIAVVAGQHLPPNNSSICAWGQQGPGGKRVVVSIYTQMGSRTPTDRFNTAKTTVESITKTPVSGVGDDAVSVTTPGVGTGLIFRKGPSAFDVRIYGFPLDEIKAREKTLALDLIAKL